MVRARENPFAVSRVDGLPFVIDRQEWDGLWRRLEALKFRAAIRGKHGCGKSRLLRAMAEEMRERGWNVKELILNAAIAGRPGALCAGLLRELKPDQILLIDGIERVSFPERWWLYLRTRRCRGLIVTIHRPGLLPVLTVCRPSVATLARIIEALTNATGVDPAKAAEHYLRRGKSIRAALRLIYDEYSLKQTLDRRPVLWEAEENPREPAWRHEHAHT